MSKILIPVIPWQMLVIPGQLAGVSIERHRRIAVQLGGRESRDGVRVAAMALYPSVRRGIGDSPVNQLARRIVRSRQPPGRCRPFVQGHVRPRVPCWLVRSRGGEKLPQFFSRQRVKGQDTVAPIPAVPHSRYDLAFDYLGSRTGVRAFRFPPKLARASVQGYQVFIGCGVDNEVLIDGDSPARSVPAVLRQLAPVLPDQIAIGGIESLNASGVGNVQDALVNERNMLVNAGRESPRPGHAKPAHILPVDLIQRTETLVVVGSTVRQPVVWTGVQEHLSCNRRILAELR